MKLRKIIYASALLVGQIAHASSFVTLNNIDPLPLFSSIYPFSFLNTESKQQIKDFDTMNIKDRFDLSVGMFGQKASSSTNQEKKHCALLDRNGRLNMIGLTYGAVPTGYTQPPLLATAAAQHFVTVPTATISDPTFSDPTQNFGFFTVDAKYHKIGLRFLTSFRPMQDFVITVQGGVADLKQTFTFDYFIDQTDNATAGNVFPGYTAPNFSTDQDNVQKLLMDTHEQIFEEMGLNIYDWHKSGPEDLTIALAWRHNFVMNKNSDPNEWAPFILTPFVQGAFTAGISKTDNPNFLLSVPFGNNKYNAFNFNGGLSLDFFNTLEIVWSGGISHFFERTLEARVPTHDLQYLLFPYKATIKSKPGNSWYMSLGLNAYHFLDKLSCYALYFYTAHVKDEITMVTVDSAFLPERLEEDTEWKAQLFDIGFNYDLSPNLSIGAAFQIPVARRSAYKSYTSIISLVGTF